MQHSIVANTSSVWTCILRLNLVDLDGRSRYMLVSVHADCDSNINPEGSLASQAFSNLSYSGPPSAAPNCSDLRMSSRAWR